MHSLLSLFVCVLVEGYLICYLTTNTNEESIVTSIDNNDELSYFYCQSLPWVNSVEALRGCASARL